MKKQRIFIGFFEIAGIFSGLKSGLLSLGHSAKLCEIETHPFDYHSNTDFDSLSEKLLKWWIKCSLGLIESSAWDGTPNFIKRIIGQAFFLLLAIKYDTFIFSGGISFADILRTAEKPFFFRVLKRKWVFIFSGTDSRAPYCSRTGYESRNELVFLRDLEDMVTAKASCLNKAETVGDVLIDFPSNSHFHQKAFVSFLHMGLPVRCAQQRSLPPESQPIRILHAPSNESIKGSKAIRLTLAKLKEEGYSFEYKEVKNMSNQTVIDLLQNTDLVIDQIYSDSPMAGFASEAAAAGVVPLVGGYFWPLLEDLQSYKEPPVIRCHPLFLYEVLKETLSLSQKSLHEKGVKIRQFVKDDFSQEAYAKRILDSAAGNAPESSLIQSGQMSYGLGCGMDLLETAECVGALNAIKQDYVFGLSSDKKGLIAFYQNLSKFEVSLNREIACVKEAVSATLFSGLSKQLIANIRAGEELYKRGVSEKTSEWQYLRNKVDDFRGMIYRRDGKIAKLEKKLKIKKHKKTNKPKRKPDKTEEGLKCYFYYDPLKSGDGLIGDRPATVVVTLDRLNQRAQSFDEILKGDGDSYRKEEVSKLKSKISNFRGMIERRNARILKLEKKLSQK